MGRAMATQVEELADNRVRLTVEVPQADLKHAVEHATSDLAGSVKVPGFRKGKVPARVLLARLGRERVFGEAVESHIGGWFLNAAASTRIRPVAAPEYVYDLPGSEDEEFQFTATVSVQPKPEPADWSKLEVPYAEPEVPSELVDEELEELRGSVAELAPVEGRPAQTGDVVVVDAVDASGEGQRDLVVELGSGRLVEEIERALTGATPGETRRVDFELADGTTATAEVTLKELKEKVLPPLDDELARAASEFETLEELRADIERRIREQAELHEDDPDKAVQQVFEAGGHEALRGDLRLRKALDRVAADAKRIPAETAQVRDEIWTPDKETPPTETKLWTPGSKEPA